MLYIVSDASRSFIQSLLHEHDLVLATHHCVSFLWPYLKAAVHSLGVSVVPLSGDGVLLEERRDPLLALGLALAGRLPLSLLQDELLVGGLRLVLVVDGPGHVLPQPEGGDGDEVDLETEN